MANLWFAIDNDKPLPRFVSEEADNLILSRRRYRRTTFGIHENIDLQSHTKIGEIDPGFDRKSQPRQDPPGVMSFQVVQVDAECVDAGARAQTVSGTMQDEIPVPRRGEDVARHLIQLPPPEHLACAPCLLQTLDDLISGFADGIEYPRLQGGDLRRRRRHPGDVAKDIDVTGMAGPQVDQQPVAAVNLGRIRRSRLVMGIAAVVVDPDDRSVIGLQSTVREFLHDKLLDLVLGDRPGLQSFGDECERGILDRVDVPAGAFVGADSLGGPRSQRDLNQIG